MKKSTVMFISSNHFSHDLQVQDAVTWLRNDSRFTLKMRTEFAEKFPEWDELKWEGSWVDVIDSDVDLEYMSWVADWIEENTPIYWRDGEPLMRVAS